MRRVLVLGLLAGCSGSGTMMMPPGDGGDTPGAVSLDGGSDGPYTAPLKAPAQKVPCDRSVLYKASQTTTIYYYFAEVAANVDLAGGDDVSAWVCDFTIEPAVATIGPAVLGTVGLTYCSSMTNCSVIGTTYPTTGCQRVAPHVVDGKIVVNCGHRLDSSTGYKVAGAYALINVRH